MLFRSSMRTRSRRATAWSSLVGTLLRYFDLTAPEIGDFVELIRSARERIDRTLRPTGYNIGVNVGTDAGQTVMHVHIHVIPRYPGDSVDPTGGVRGVIPGMARYGQKTGQS